MLTSQFTSEYNVSVGRQVNVGAVSSTSSRSIIKVSTQPLLSVIAMVSNPAERAETILFETEPNVEVNV